MVYFDCAATTKPTEKVIQDITEGMRGDWFNPSSISEESRRVKLKIEYARKQVADFINAKSDEIIFTSGGSESNNLAIRGLVENCKNEPHALFCSQGEHPSIYNVIQRYRDLYYYTEFLPLQKNGKIDLEQLNRQLQGLYLSTIYFPRMKNHKPFNPLVCLSYVNNEIGAVNPVQEISKIVHKHSGILLIDAVQAIGYRDIDVKSMGIDMLSASFHKFGGVRGCGFLYIKKNIQDKISPLIIGGHQENNLRAGTEASYLITAMGNRLEELKKTQKERQDKINNIRTRIIDKLFDNNDLARMMWINGESINSHSHIISLTIKGIPSQELMTLLNIDGVIVSAGSACSSGEEKPSRVLKAIGLSDEDAKSTIRISFNEFTTENDIDMLIESLTKNILILKELHSEDKPMN